MSVMKFMQTTSSEGKAKAVSSEETIPADAKKIGSYMCVDTKYVGIKRVVSKQGGYLVLLDYGRQYKLDKRTGVYVLKQCKSTRHVDTEEEARKLRREAEEIRSGEAIRNTDRKFVEAVEDFKSSERFKELGLSYKENAKNYLRHAMEYFTNVNVKDISVPDMEKYFKFLQENGNRKKNSNRLKVNTINKHKSMLIKVWDYFIESKKYGITENVADRARLPKVEIIIDGKVKMVSKEKFNSRPLSIEELNYTLNDIAQNEFDRSMLVCVGLAAIGTLRRSELIGIRFGKFFHNEFTDVSEEACEYGGFDKEYYKQHDELMFVDTGIMTVNGKRYEKLPKNDKVRVSAIPNCLKKIVEYALEQRKEVYDILGKEFSSTEPIYLPLVNVISGKILYSNKLSRKWKEYQVRRNKRMIDQGLEPIDIIRLHDLRHTHAVSARIKVPAWEISANMGHKVPEMLNNTTTKFYWLDRQPNRDNIIKFFDEVIKIDWDKAMNIPINRENGKISINGSGHLVISEEETQRRKNNGLNFVFKEEELEELLKSNDKEQ